VTRIVSHTPQGLRDRRSALATEPPPSHSPTNEIRVLTRDECLRLLAAHDFGRLAVSMETPVIRPVNYIFDDRSQSVVFRTAGGSKFHAMLLQAKAAFEIDGIDAGSRTGWSVIIVGVAEEITNPSEVRRLERLGLEHWAPGPKPHWMRIRAWTVTGRQIAGTSHPTAAKPA
jgi:nitroimidazol reductase NimA-like FMN-containing flavoprotein (pyridoxamine 5'-phosphate oxidase superfamily)